MILTALDVPSRFSLVLSESVLCPISLAQPITGDAPYSRLPLTEQRVKSCNIHCCLTIDYVTFQVTHKYDINPASFIKDFPLKRWMPYYYSMRISRLMQTMLFRNFFNFLFSSFIIFRFCRRSFYLFSFVFSLSGASLPLTLPHLLFFSTNYKNTHVCEEKRPGSAASASEVFLRSLPFFILPFFAFPLLLSILFPIFVR